MKIKWLGHSAFVLTAGDGTRVMTDPYVAGSYDGGVGYAPIKEPADVVTVSHEHPDHNNAKNIRGKPEIIRQAGHRETHGIVIDGVLTCHDKTGGRERGLNTVFCITVDGIRVCHLGDLGHDCSDKETAAIGPVDVLLIPVGGFFTIDAEEVNRTIARLKPKIVVPMHYKTEKLSFPIADVEEFLRHKTGVRRMGRSEVEITRAGLPETTEIWVLAHEL